MTTFEIKQSEDGQYYFVLRAKNRKVIAVSELYTKKHNCIKGIESVMVNAPTAKIVNQS